MRSRASGRVLLAVDVGNTMTHYGLFRGDKLVWRWRLETRHFQGQTLKMPKMRISEAVAASVVPKLKLNLGVPALFVNDRLDLRMRVHAKGVGADRLANAVAAKFLYGYPAFVVDFGTAITIDVISKKGDYLGGVIMPGMDMIRHGLHERTALLPLVDIKRPARILGQTTQGAIRSGMYYGVKGMIDYLLDSLKKELRFPEKTVIINTGGYARLFGGRVDNLLTLKGLKIIYERNRDNRSAFICK